jgi:hypothetical protein
LSGFDVAHGSMLMRVACKIGTWRNYREAYGLIKILVFPLMRCEIVMCQD